MKISEIILEVATDGATASENIAAVSMPLFGDPAMIRRAVDPYGYTINRPNRKKVKPKNYSRKVKSVYPEDYTRNHRKIKEQ